MVDITGLCRKAVLAQVILDAIENHKLSDDEAKEVLTTMADTLHDGDSDWATELIYEANELNKDGREI